MNAKTQAELEKTGKTNARISERFMAYATDYMETSSAVKATPPPAPKNNFSSGGKGQQQKVQSPDAKARSAAQAQNPNKSKSI